MANTKITTAVIKDDAITTAKIADDAVTGELIADDVALAGNPTTTTQSAGNNTTRIATTAFVTTAINNLVDSAPSALDTLNELAAAMGDDANFSTTVTNSIATKLPLAGGTLTGDLILGDSVQIEFGSATGGDANIRHDGNNTKFTHTGAGGLYLGADTFALQNGTHDENFIVMADNGAVTLYHDNAAKLATTSTGISVTGDIAATKSSGDLILSGTASAAGNYSSVRAVNNSGTVVQLLHYGSSKSAYGALSSGGSSVYSNAAELVLMADNGSGVIKFATGGYTERMRIAADGTTTIGRAITATYDNDQGYPLHIQASGGSQTYLSISVPGDNSGDTGVVIGHDATGTRIVNRENQPILFHTGSSSGLTFTMEAGGDFSIADGNLVLASGHGIDFSATGNSSGSMSSELLDDYEEGTWTPQLEDASGNDCGQASQTGHYTKIGNKVYVHFAIGVNSKSGVGNALQISGLPFTVENVAYGSGEPSAGLISYATSLTSGAYGAIIARANNASTFLELKYTGAGNITTYLGTALNAADIGASTYITGSCTYRS